MPQFGYAGKILTVDLSTGKTATLPTTDYAAYLGGRGTAARLHWENTPGEASAFDERNTLVFSIGPLAGIPVLGGSRWVASGKSPMRDPEHLCHSNLGGRWGAELKFCGYDAVMIHGTSERPVYLLLRDEAAELRDASAFSGMGAVETRAALKSVLGDSARVVAIGPAGEKMVSTASLMADNDASGSAGLGAVMGSKQLKAVAVQSSSKKVSIAQPDRLRDIIKYYRSLGKGVFTAWGSDFMVSGPQARKDPCYGCLGNCLRVIYTASDGRKGKFMCQSGLFYLQWAMRFYGEQNEVPFHANRLCDDYGLDTWSLEAMIAWLYRCYRAGLITDEATGLPLSRIGSMEFIEELVAAISYRRGFGDVLAQGVERAAGALGGQAVDLIRHIDPYEPRLYNTTALLWAMEPREPIQELHEVGLPLAQWSSWAKSIDGAYVDSEVMQRIAERFWGSREAADFTTFEGKALAAKLIQDRQYAKECLIVCDWIFPVMEIKNSEDHVGDSTLESQILSAVTGREVDEQELNGMGERVFNLQRAIMVRDGHRGREDDRIPEEWHSAPLKRGAMDPECLVPGPSGEVTSRIGAVVDREEFEAAKDEYYRIRGWDVATGLQRVDALCHLGLEDVARHLQEKGLAVST